MNKSLQSKRWFIMLVYSVGYLGISILVQTTVKWYQYFYAPPELNKNGLSLLIPLGLIGFTMAIARIFDGLANPIVAYFSDSSRNKLGRRIPFVLYGSVPLIISFILIWFPPVKGQSVWNFIYLTVVLSLFFTFFTIVVDPYLALIGDISRNKEDRIKLTMAQGIAQVLGVMVAEAGSGIIIGASGFKTMGIILGVVSFATIILTPIFVRENPLEENERQPLGIWSSIKRTLTNRNFLYYLIPYLAIWFGINTLTISMPYICEILLGMKAEDSGFMIAGAFIVATLFSPLLPKITLRFGKKKVMLFSQALFGFILLLISTFGSLLGITAAYIIVFIAGIPLSAALIVPNAMVADIAELDAIENGQRREGMFFGTQGLINKLMVGLSSVVTPTLFNVFGYTRESPLGLQLCGPVAGILVLAGIFILRRYSLTEEKLEQAKVK
jgi:Na+/melibiose symporter and related transporters